MEKKCATFPNSFGFGYVLHNLECLIAKMMLGVVEIVGGVFLLHWYLKIHDSSGSYYGRLLDL